MTSKVRQAIAFLTVGIWRVQSRKLPRSKSLVVRAVRIILLTLRGFGADRCSLRASALTFYSILSIVPAVALAFGVAKGFGLEEKLAVHLKASMAGQEEAAEKIIEFSRSILENAKGGVIAGIGIAVLFWTVIKVLGNIERSFNAIWGLKKSRPVARRFADYLAMMLICPFFLIVSSAITIAERGEVQAVVDKVAILGFLAPVILVLLKVAPFCLGWGLFAFVYKFMPNTKVNLRSAIVGGVLAGTLYQILQWVYVSFQIGVSRYSALYGSFAAAPLFFIWLQFSWLVVLFGAELSFAHQNVETYEFEADCLQVSHSFKTLLALVVTHLLVKKFQAGAMPMTAEQISHELTVPIRLTNDVLFELVGAGVLSEARLDGEREVGYQPGRSIDALTVGYVVGALERRGSDDIPFVESQQRQRLSECLKGFSDAIEASAANVALKDV